MTDAEYTAWLADEGNVRCLLVDIEYRSSGGSTIKDYLSTHPFVTEPTDTPANTDYRNVIIGLPSFSQEMTDVLLGRTTASGGNVVVSNGDGALDSWITQNWVGRPFVMYLGSPDWPKADFRAVWTGVTASIAVNGTQSLSLAVRARDHLLSQDVLTTKYTSGPSKGRYKPLAYGTCYNVTPLFIGSSDTDHDYAINAADVYAIDTVRVNGKALAGSDWTDNSDGTFTLDNKPNGAVTVDFRGMYSGGTLYEKIKDIVKDLCVTRGPFLEADFENTNSEWTNLNTTFAQTMGLWIPEPKKYYELLDQICASVGAFYTVTRDGKILIKQFALSGTATLSLDADAIPARGLGIRAVYQPLDNLRRGYARQWTVQQVTGDDLSLDIDFVGETAAIVATPTHGETDRETWGNEYKWVVATNAGAANILKTKDPPGQGTLLKTESACQTEADRWMDIWEVPRVRYAIDCFLDGARVNLGDRVQVTHPRLGLSAGATGTVVKIVDQFVRRRQTLELLL